MRRRVVIVSLALIVLASGFVVVLGPARFHPPGLNAVGRPSPALPTTPLIGQGVRGYASIGPLFPLCTVVGDLGPVHSGKRGPIDRKSTRLNSSHVRISYAVFCLKKKKNKLNDLTTRIARI